jgi:hypothetical protein
VVARPAAPGEAFLAGSEQAVDGEAVQARDRAGVKSRKLNEPLFQGVLVAPTPAILTARRQKFCNGSRKGRGRERGLGMILDVFAERLLP